MKAEESPGGGAGGAEVSPARLLGRLRELRRQQMQQHEALRRQQLQQCGPSATGLGPAREEALQALLGQVTAECSSYRTFRRLLSESESDSPDTSRGARSLSSRDLVDGVSVLNLSRESECLVYSPLSAEPRLVKTQNVTIEKRIELDEMPILSPRTDFETMVLQKIQNENTNHKESSNEARSKNLTKKPFLRRGEGLNRFGIKKDNLVIQNTKSLPWKKRNSNSRRSSTSKNSPELRKCVDDDIELPKSKSLLTHKNIENIKLTQPSFPQKIVRSNTVTIIEPPKRVDDPKKETATQNKSNKTWAAILTEEQDNFLKQLKQSSYYKNFESPAKSIASDISCDEHLQRLLVEKESAEQNLFNLLENKVSNASFCSESSFLNKLFRRNNTDCSGDSTPLNIQRCLANNPQLLQLFPLPQAPLEVTEQTVEESCDNECMDCDHETCSSSSCCTCKTVEESKSSILTSTPQIKEDAGSSENKSKKSREKEELDETVKQDNIMKANMVEMNAKLTATSELLKERLHELEDEIEMFRKENCNLTKLREELDLEKQRFFDERAAYEQKFNEDKVLSEYYLAEEKEKLAKQKQVYDRYVREMRGRLNKKDKDEVTKLKKEIDELKDEFRSKDAKSTSCIARLRNQLKSMEKEKKDLQDECEKLRKENKRIQQVNTTTRRLSNIKYLSEINRKLALIGANDKNIDVIIDEDVKYKSQEISNRSRPMQKVPPKRGLLTKAKSVPNLTVTSRYAKYFSQRDAISQMEHDREAGGDYVDAASVKSDHSSDVDYHLVHGYESDVQGTSSRSSKRNIEDMDDHIEENNLEKMYLETFRDNYDNFKSFENISNEYVVNRLSGQSGKSYTTLSEGRKSPISITRFGRSVSPNSAYNLLLSGSNQTLNRSESPVPALILSRSGSGHTMNRSKSPISILSNRSSMSGRKPSITHEHISPPKYQKYCHLQSDEDNVSKASVNRTNLNPTEIKRPDGTRELRFPNGNVKIISSDGKSAKFMYYNGDIKETFYNEGRIKYFYAETKTYHTTHPDGLEVLQFPDGQVEKRYKDGSIEIRLPNGSVRYTDPKNEHVSEEWRFPDGTVLTVARSGEQVVRFANGQVEVHAKDHKRREFPDGTVKLVYADGTAETRYSSGRVRIKDRHGKLIMDSQAAT